MANAFAIGDINADVSHACVQEYADGVRAFCRERVPVDTAVLGTRRLFLTQVHIHTNHRH